MALPADFPAVPIPPQPTVALLDPATGRISAEWYRYFKDRQRFDDAVRARLDAET